MPLDNILVLAAAAATEAEGGNVATQIFDTFKIYPVTFICQLVNFLIVSIASTHSISYQTRPSGPRLLVLCVCVSRMWVRLCGG